MNNMKTKENSFELQNHKIIKTLDNDITLYSKTFDENAHSLFGAIKETFFHYINGCHVIQKAKEYPHLRILEVGLGAGVGLIETYKAVKDFYHKNTNQKFTYIGLEIDEELIYYFNECNPSFALHNNNNKDIFEYVKENICFKIYLGDARKTISKVNGPIHAVYQDAYCPKSNPTLWTKEWFKEVRSKCHDDVHLSTYSSSISVRKSMIKAGFHLYEGGPFGKKKSCTRARLVGQTDDEILSKLQSSKTPALSDSHLL